MLPSILIAIFSLFYLMLAFKNILIKKLKSVVNNSAEVARNYVSQTRNSVEADILLILIDINSKFRFIL